jgi:hypothetical protein
MPSSASVSVFLIFGGAYSVSSGGRIIPSYAVVGCGWWCESRHGVSLVFYTVYVVFGRSGRLSPFSGGNPVRFSFAAIVHH